MKICEKLKRGDLRDALITYALNETQLGRIETMSLRKVARDLGVSSGAVYRHFADKEALYTEVVEIGLNMLQEKFFAIRPEGDAATSVPQVIERFYKLSRVYIRFAHDNPTLWQMMFGRLGIQCRKESMKDPSQMRYTTFDVLTCSCDDLFNIGGIAKRPDIQDHRYIWSASHGAADLAQYGMRMDGEELESVADETTKRNLKLIGYTADQ